MESAAYRPAGFLKFPYCFLKFSPYTHMTHSHFLGYEGFCIWEPSSTGAAPFFFLCFMLAFSQKNPHTGHNGAENKCSRLTFPTLKYLFIYLFVRFFAVTQFRLISLNKLIMWSVLKKYCLIFRYYAHNLFHVHILLGQILPAFSVNISLSFLLEICVYFSCY